MLQFMTISDFMINRELLMRLLVKHSGAIRFRRRKFWLTMVLRVNAVEFVLHLLRNLIQFAHQVRLLIDPIDTVLGVGSRTMLSSLINKVVDEFHFADDKLVFVVRIGLTQIRDGGVPIDMWINFFSSCKTLIGDIIIIRSDRAK